MEVSLWLALVFSAAYLGAARSNLSKGHEPLRTIETRSIGTYGATYYVDGLYGNDSNAGTFAAPLLTLNQARNAIRTLKTTGGGLPVGGVLVLVRGRDYFFLSTPFSLAQQDSGTPQAPIVYQSYPGDSPAHLTAGTYVTPNLYTPVTDQWVLNLTGNSSNIVQVNLKQLGITSYGNLGSGSLGNCNNNKLELFYPDRVMVLARYPNISPAGVWQFLLIGKVLNSQTSFVFNDSRISHWKNISTLWLHGFWSYDWADNYIAVVSINTTTSSFLINNVTTPPLYGFLPSARYYALNTLEELDSPNEYYVDRGSGIMYLYNPPQETGCVSVGSSIISMLNVSYVSFIGFTMDCARGTAVTATTVANVTFSNCTIINNGGSSLSISGYNNTLDTLEVSGNGCGGVYVGGGVQATLTPGFNTLRYSSIHDWSRWKRTYVPGISWGGVGNSFVDNTIYNAPHSGILGTGNNCNFTGNFIHDLCYEVTDSGAFYSGRSWISGGNVIANNVFSNIKTTEKVYLGSPSVQAIYLDDQMSGYQVINNTFINCYAGTFLGGGRSNVVSNNLYINCSTAVHLDNRGLTWQTSYCSAGGIFEQQLQSVNYQQPPWSVAFPQLVNITTDHPCVPCYNLISNNTYCQVGKFTDFNTTIAAVQWLTTVTNNNLDCSSLNPTSTPGTPSSPNPSVTSPSPMYTSTPGAGHALLASVGMVMCLTFIVFVLSSL